MQVVKGVAGSGSGEESQAAGAAPPPHRRGGGGAGGGAPPPAAALRCPRCDSANTKFCYYNNYSLLQPRYFCKGCRRYWTKGGALRNVPVGGGCRKNKRSSSAGGHHHHHVNAQLHNLNPPHVHAQMPMNHPLVASASPPNPHPMNLNCTSSPLALLPPGFGSISPSSLHFVNHHGHPLQPITPSTPPTFHSGANVIGSIPVPPLLSSMNAAAASSSLNHLYGFSQGKADFTHQQLLDHLSSGSNNFLNFPPPSRFALSQPPTSSIATTPTNYDNHMFQIPVPEDRPSFVHSKPNPHIDYFAAGSAAAERPSDQDAHHNPQSSSSNIHHHPSTDGFKLGHIQMRGEEEEEGSETGGAQLDHRISAGSLMKAPAAEAGLAPDFEHLHATCTDAGNSYDASRSSSVAAVHMNSLHRQQGSSVIQYHNLLNDNQEYIGEQAGGAAVDHHHMHRHLLLQQMPVQLHYQRHIHASVAPWMNPPAGHVQVEQKLLGDTEFDDQRRRAKAEHHHHHYQQQQLQLLRCSSSSSTSPAAAGSHQELQLHGGGAVKVEDDGSWGAQASSAAAADQDPTNYWASSSAAAAAYAHGQNSRWSSTTSTTVTMPAGSHAYNHSNDNTTNLP